MPVEGFYYTFGNDSDLLEKRWLPGLEKKYSKATWLRYDAVIDKIDVGNIVTEYNVNDLFAEGKVVVIRNADSKQAANVHALTEALLSNPVPGNALILLGASWNKTTKLGKLVKKSFRVKELTKPELKPFDMLDCLNSKNLSKTLFHCGRLFENGQNHLAMFSLLFGHFLLLRQVVQRKGQPADEIARDIKQHVFRVKKAMVANQFWTLGEIDNALQELMRLDSFLRFSEYDRTMTTQKMLVQMSLIKITL